MMLSFEMSDFCRQLTFSTAFFILRGAATIVARHFA
jgi:hypothetical protein